MFIDRKEAKFPSYLNRKAQFKITKRKPITRYINRQIHELSTNETRCLQSKVKLN